QAENQKGEDELRACPYRRVEADHSNALRGEQRCGGWWWMPLRALRGARRGVLEPRVYSPRWSWEDEHSSLAVARGLHRHTRRTPRPKRQPLLRRRARGEPTHVGEMPAGRTKRPPRRASTIRLDHYRITVFRTCESGPCRRRR